MRPGYPSTTRRNLDILISALSLPSSFSSTFSTPDLIHREAHNSNGLFTVKLCYSRLIDGGFRCAITPLIMSMITILLKVRFFGWILSRDRLPTKSGLISRGLPLPNSSCILCGFGTEDGDHLFRLCFYSISGLEKPGFLAWSS